MASLHGDLLSQEELCCGVSEKRTYDSIPGKLGLADIYIYVYLYVYIHDTRAFPN